jgi:NadR type nicotinamide-nucleotide adenylyltransferase
MAAVDHEGSGRVKRVVVTGSESTGKTTLARDLAAHFGTVWIPEYVRGYLDAKGAELTADDVEPIAMGQIEECDATIAASKHELIVLDTDLLSTETYAAHYYGVRPDWIHNAVLARRADLYLLCDIDVPWKPDPQRDRPHHREQIHQLFRAELEAIGANVVDVRGTWEERFAIAVRAVEEMLNAD